MQSVQTPTSVGRSCFASSLVRLLGHFCSCRADSVSSEYLDKKSLSNQLHCQYGRILPPVLRAFSFLVGLLSLTYSCSSMLRLEAKATTVVYICVASQRSVAKPDACLILEMEAFERSQDRQEC